MVIFRCGDLTRGQKHLRELMTVAAEWPSRRDFIAVLHSAINGFHPRSILMQNTRNY